jgi:predicted DNA-binding transcriptional regulator YafY
MPEDGASTRIDRRTRGREPMDRFHRIYLLHRALAGARVPVSRQQLEAQLECRPATVKRVIELLRGYGAPIEYVRDANGYRYGPDRAFELPGVWFNAGELHALRSAQMLLTEAEPGLLADLLKPLAAKIDRLLQAKQLGGGEAARRVRIIRLAGRGTGPCFAAVAEALMRRRRLRIRYWSRGTDELALREVSPQRLVHYRDNWYLDGWCHSSKALRTFSLDCVRNARVLERTARDLDDATLDAELGSTYGIFSGRPSAEAVLRFSAFRARWVASEQWHPRQQGRTLDDGRYELRLPYDNPTELAMDILRYGADVEVLAPESLRSEIAERLRAAAALYSGRRTK